MLWERDVGVMQLIAHDTLENSSLYSGGATLQWTMPYEEIKNVNQRYVVNMDILTTPLHACQHCHKGPHNLCNISEDVCAGVSPVSKVRCCHCMEINIIIQRSTIILAKETLNLRHKFPFQTRSNPYKSRPFTLFRSPINNGTTIANLSKLQNSGKRGQNGDRSCG